MERVSRVEGSAMTSWHVVTTASELLSAVQSGAKAIEVQRHHRAGLGDAHAARTAAHPRGPPGHPHLGGRRDEPGEGSSGPTEGDRLEREAWCEHRGHPR